MFTLASLWCGLSGSIGMLVAARVVQGVAWPLDFYRSRHAAVVLSHSLWQTRFGSDPSIVGRSIELDASLYDVVGVAEAGFDFPADSGLYRSANLMSDQNRTVRSVAVVATRRSANSAPISSGENNAIANANGSENAHMARKFALTIALNTSAWAEACASDRKVITGV